MKNYLFIFVFLFGFQITAGQETLSAIELENLLDKVEMQSQKYTKIFRNLSAEETKTIFYFNKKGDVEEKRIVKSIFTVYQSPHGNEAHEFRHVLEFNGRNVQRSTNDMEKFFKKIVKNKKKERNKLVRESLRYDGYLRIWGMTLNNTSVVKKPFRNVFDFSFVGKGMVNQNEVWIIKYRQRKTSPYVLVNPTRSERKQVKETLSDGTQRISRHFQPTRPLMMGEMWIDAKTSQVWRNEFKIFINPYRLSKPVVVSEELQEYQPSDFGILTPKIFMFRVYGVSGKNDASLAVSKDTSRTYSYSKFKEFKTDVENYEIK